MFEQAILADMEHQLAKLQSGRRAEKTRLQEIDKYPATLVYAKKHCRANKFGVPKPSLKQQAVCPCCEEILQNKRVPLSASIKTKGISGGVSLFFAFIKMVMIYFAFHILISQGFNIITNHLGHDCGKGDQVSCPKDQLFPKWSTTNKMEQKTLIRILDILNLVVVILSIAFFIYFRRKQYKDYLKIENKNHTENDYAVYVKNIPIIVFKDGKMSYVSSLKKHFQKIVMDWILEKQTSTDTHDSIFFKYRELAAIKGHSVMQPNRIVANVDLCWNLFELIEIEKQKDLYKDAYQAEHKNDDLQQFDNRNSGVVSTEIDAIENSYLDICQQFQRDQTFGFNASRFIGKAFITFEYEHFAKIVQRRIRDKKEGAHLFMGNELKIQIAAYPKDVNWENLNVEKKVRVEKLITTFLITVGALIFAFAAIIAVNYWQQQFGNKEVKPQATIKDKAWNYALSIGASVMINGINYILKTIIGQLVTYQQHETKTSHQVSYVTKVLAAQFFNTAITIYVATIILRNQIWDRNGIIMQVSSLLTTSAVINIGTNFFYISAILREIKLCLFYRGQKLHKFQDRFNAIYELPDFDLPGRYAYYILYVYMTCFFSYITPIGGFVLIIVFACQYWIDKFNLFKRSSNKNNYNFIMTRTMLKLFESCILFFTVGNFVFSFYFHEIKWQPINMIAIAISIFYVIIIWILPYRFEHILFRIDESYEECTYTQCEKQGEFEHTYRNQNPPTRLVTRPSENYESYIQNIIKEEEEQEYVDQIDYDGQEQNDQGHQDHNQFNDGNQQQQQQPLIPNHDYNQYQPVYQQYNNGF